jgi:hypothetical protein
MNRIYQGRVSKVEILKPGDKENPWQPFPTGRKNFGVTTNCFRTR